VRVEVEASVDFRGRLETVLRSTDSPTWQPVDARNAAWLDVELDLVADRAETFDLLYDPYRALGGYRGIAWRVRDHDGSLVANGFAQTARLDPVDETLHWALYVTPSKVDGRRRAPVDAYRVAFRYAPYRTVVIASRDLVALDDVQRRALFHATAFGRTLVVCGDTAGLAEPVRDALALEESVIWRGDDGAELREAPLVFGIIRHFPGTLEELIASDEPVRKLVGLASGAHPWQAEYNTYPVFLWRYILSLPDEAEDMLAVRVVFLLILGMALIAVGVSWFAARKHPPLPRRVLVGLVVIVCIAAPLGHQLLVANPVGNISQDAATVWHDAFGTTQIVQAFKEGGGGGGTTPTVIHYRRGSNALWYPLSSGTRWRTVVESSDRERIESIGLSNASNQRLGFIGLYSERIDPAWVGSAAWGEDGLSGRLRAGHDFDAAVLVGFRGSAAIGAVRAGQEIDLQNVDLRIGHDHLSPADLGLIADSWHSRSSMGPFDFTLPFVRLMRILRGTEIFIVARDTSPHHLVHVQPIRMASIADAPPICVRTLVPCADLGSTYRLFVPETIFDSWPIGTEIGPAFISFTVDEDLEAPRLNGFRVIDVEPAYRTAGDNDNPYFELRWCGGNWT
jgi:hypothetical protein